MKPKITTTKDGRIFHPAAECCIGTVAPSSGMPGYWIAQAFPARAHQDETLHGKGNAVARVVERYQAAAHV